MSNTIDKFLDSAPQFSDLVWEPTTNGCINDPKPALKAKIDVLDMGLEVWIKLGLPVGLKKPYDGMLIFKYPLNANLSRRLSLIESCVKPTKEDCVNFLLDLYFKGLKGGDTNFAYTDVINWFNEYLPKVYKLIQESK
jgi:hypothetical protein